jgi:hypothetical protein
MPAWERRNRRWKRKPYRAHYNASHRAKRKALGAGLGVELHGYWTRRRSPGSYVVTRAHVEQPRY